KLPHYILPVYPAVAIAAAWLLTRKAFTRDLPGRTYKQAAALWGFIAALQLAAALFLSWLFEIEAGPVLAVLIAVYAGLAALAAFAAWTKRVHLAAATAVLSAVLF